MATTTEVHESKYELWNNTEKQTSVKLQGSTAKPAKQKKKSNYVNNTTQQEIK